LKHTYLKFSLLAGIVIGTFAGHAQCTGGTAEGVTLTPTAVWQTVTTHSDKYYKFNAIAGDVYIFSYCSCDGGVLNYAADLTIDSVNGGVAVVGNYQSSNFNEAGAYNYSPCSTQVTWKCNVTGVYDVLTNVDYCAVTTGKTATMAYIQIPPTVCYSVSSPAYAFDAYGTGTDFQNTGIDDAFAKGIPIGFQFCYNSIFYDSVILSTNGYIIFKHKNHCDSIVPKAQNFSSYTTEPQPFNDVTQTVFSSPAVMFPWEDLYPVLGGTLKYKVYGVAPNRHLTITLNDVPLFQCNAKLITTQVQLFETTYKIQINSDTIPRCASWTPGGNPVIALVDSTGFAAVVPAGRNQNTNWVEHQQSWLFTPTGCCPVPLPVELIDFSCSGVSNGIALNWMTATETNNRFFTIQHSLDGINFTTIAQIPGAGNSTDTRNYTYTDTNTLGGINYYRLLQTDFDGKTKTFNTTSCTSGKVLPGTIFPNPASGSFTVCLGPSQNVQTLTIYDLVGRKVQSQQFDPADDYQNHIILVPNLKGLYFVELTGGQENVIRKVVLK